MSGLIEHQRDYSVEVYADKQWVIDRGLGFYMPLWNQVVNHIARVLYICQCAAAVYLI